MYKSKENIISEFFMYPQVHKQAADLAVTLYTSGTTGRSTGHAFARQYRFERQSAAAASSWAYPTYYVRLLADSSFDHNTCRNARLPISGSASSLADIFTKFSARTGHTILERYGMSELRSWPPIRITVNGAAVLSACHCQVCHCD